MTNLTGTTDVDLADNLIHRVNVGDTLTRTAYRTPDALAISADGKRFSYWELNAWVNRVASGLTERGYSRGDVLALASGNSAEFLVTYYACAKLGVVCVPLNLGWRSEEIAYVLGHSGSTGLVVESQLIDWVAPALPESPAIRAIFVAPGTGELPSADVGGVPTETFEQLGAGTDESDPERFVADRDPLTYLYTSGTTSFPKGVVGNHTAIYLESMTMALEGQFRADDRFVAMMPMFHTAQLNCHCTPAVTVGAAMHVIRAFDPEVLLGLIETEGITQIFGLPMMYGAMLEHPDIATRDLSTLRRALYAMAPMAQTQLEKCIEVFDCEFYLLFGQTEMSPTTTIFRPEHQLTHNGAAGTPVANVQVAIMDTDGSLLPQGELGEIVYRGPHALTEYLNNAEATEQAFAHGWFHSGDVGRFDKDGLLWFADRFKDVIKTGGENVASIEIERALYAADPAIAEAVVVGLPHERWSEAITAIVVPKGGQTVDAERVRESLRAHLDAYKIPKAVIVADELPKTSTGKIQKHLLRDRHRDHFAQG